MDLAIPATRYTAPAPIQDRSGAVLLAPQPVDASKPELAARNRPEQERLNQARQQARAPLQTSNPATVTLISRTRTDFEYQDAFSVMKVTDKDVLIYQVPAKGALEIIKAEEKQASRIETAV